MVETTFEEAQARVLRRYGVESEQRWVDLGGRRVAVLVAGQGPPVVMINGAGTPAAMFAPLMAEIEGRTLYAVDWPGHGSSDPDPELAGDLRTNAVIFLTAVIDALGLDRPAVIANSFGGWASIRLALEHPDRVGALILLGCPAVVPGTSAPLPMRLLSIRPLARQMMRLQPPSAGQVRRLSKLVGEHPLEPEIAEVLLAAEREPHFEASFVGIVQSLVRLRGGRSDVQLSEGDLAGVEQPTLLVFGSHDPFGGTAVGKRLAAGLPGARLHVVDAGHAPWLRHSRAIGQLIEEFLTVGRPAS